MMILLFWMGCFSTPKPTPLEECRLECDRVRDNSAIEWAARVEAAKKNAHESCPDGASQAGMSRCELTRFLLKLEEGREKEEKQYQKEAYPKCLELCNLRHK